MSELETKILDTFGKVIPKLSTLDKERVLAFGEGMAYRLDNNDKVNMPTMAIQDNREEQ